MMKLSRLKTLLPGQVTNKRAGGMPGLCWLAIGIGVLLPAIVPVRVLAQATDVDLVMTSVSTTATSVPIGGSFTIANTVMNQGTTITSNTFSVGVYLSTDTTITTADTQLNIRTVFSLAAGASDSGSLTVIIPTYLAPGTYYIGAIADYGNEIGRAHV